MNSSRDDVLDLFGYVWQRFRTRMEGLGDEEWRWQPSRDDRVTLRTGAGRAGAGPAGGVRTGTGSAGAAPTGELCAESAVAALAEVEAAYGLWRNQLAAISDESFEEPIGPAAGHYGDATRRSFALHIVDELIHHAAEAALLRDLYAGRD